MSSKLAIVGGGSGFIGRSLCKALEKQGYTTKIISRSNKRGQLTWTDIERNGIPEETKAVYNLAGELVLNPLKRLFHVLIVRYEKKTYSG